MGTSQDASRKLKTEPIELAAREAEHIGNVATLSEREGKIAMDKGLILQQRLEDIGFRIIRVRP